MRHLYPSSDAAARTADSDEARADKEWGYDPEDIYTFGQYMEYMRKDALVMEMLSSSSRSVDVYAHCAMSSAMEWAVTDMEDYILPTAGMVPQERMGTGAGPLNEYISYEEKLSIALEMAKCLAVMHGHPDGPIVHGDIQLGQFYRGQDGKIKIVDYNRAEMVFYDEEKGRYCKWRNGFQENAIVSRALC